ncbi:MAG: glucose-6-phosphate isomerase [Clostridia bacterium]|nr:glucose-6-phosphate isomerase [Clostridia bacterium]
MKNITVNYSDAFITEEAMQGLLPQMLPIEQKIADKDGDFLGWVDYPARVEPALITDIKQTAAEIRGKCTAFVICGVGGSYLGAKAAISLLTSCFHNETNKVPKLYFAGHHLGSSYYAELLAAIKDEEICICVISKSGKTMETSIAFSLLKALLIDKYGQAEAAKRIYAVTDPVGGLLRKEASEKGYKAYQLDGDIGGRYSVLTPVGLLPLAVAGLDIEQVLAGAKAEQAGFCGKDLLNIPCYQYAAARTLLREGGKYVEIFASFEPKLQYFGEWLKQLFGESEGKQHKGLFPASVQFSSDLHSLGQFLQDGSPIFFETFLQVQKPQRDLIIFDPLFAPAGRSLHEINCLVEHAACRAHIDGGAPCLLIKIPEISEHAFGQMVYFFERACAMACYLTGVNPFDQPGVEKYKANVRELLGQ